jgi:hypothetical protein
VRPPQRIILPDLFPQPLNHPVSIKAVNHLNFIDHSTQKKRLRSAKPLFSSGCAGDFSYHKGHRFSKKAVFIAKVRITDKKVVIAALL